ncbi:hypothetical protein GWI33_005426 [Rhynchophorus ferrugineus]|uniref:Uncharacterized protein n=1 Tax=Rhynchophorus ferrugineus TaxID=354439 RepID=A0A834IGR9_RHYFE|nr:hypothetical protein GWI33_005426 [Rhynchophorus ferrugineus]
MSTAGGERSGRPKEQHGRTIKQSSGAASPAAASGGGDLFVRDGPAIERGHERASFHLTIRDTAEERSSVLSRPKNDRGSADKWGAEPRVACSGALLLLLISDPSTGTRYIEFRHRTFIVHRPHYLRRDWGLLMISTYH